MAASLSGIITLMIITYTILVNYTEFSISVLFFSIYKYMRSLLVRYKLKLRLILLTLLITLFTIAIGYVSNNRGGDFIYLIKLIPTYIKQTYIYSLDIFNYFITGEPAKCGLQSNILLYFFDPKPVSICLNSYRNTLFDSGLFRDGAWVGLFGAHAIDFGSNMVILSILITLAIYYFLTKLILNISFLKNIRPIISIILIIYFSLTIAFLFTGFISANYIIILMSVLNIIVLRVFSLIRIYKFDPNNRF